MTFSIVGRCSKTGQLGIAVSSSSIAVGARCAWGQDGVGVVATQNVTLPALGPRILELIGVNRMELPTAVGRALDADSWKQYRQVIAIDSQGQSAMFTGQKALGVHNAIRGNQCAAAGNLLSQSSVIEAMVHAFEEAPGFLAERLLSAMRAAKAGGGEAGPVHSAALKVYGDVSWPIVDLRVDWDSADPIGALEVLWSSYQPQMQDYLNRALNPVAASSYGVPGDQ